jgi:hypothetical protein
VRHLTHTAANAGFHSVIAASLFLTFVRVGVVSIGNLFWVQYGEDTYLTNLHLLLGVGLGGESALYRVVVHNSV